MCPRVLKKKVNVTDLSTLIPELPQPNDLKPFPSRVSIEFKKHKTCVRSISVSTCGNFLASADEDSQLIIWCTRTTRVLREYTLPNKVTDSLAWCPAKNKCLLLVANEENLIVIAPELYTKFFNRETAALLASIKEQFSANLKANESKHQAAYKMIWDFEGEHGLTLKFSEPLKQVVWHHKGDFFASLVANQQTSTQVLIHSIAKC